MKQQREKRETDTSTYPGEVLNHFIQVHIFSFKYIRGPGSRGFCELDMLDPLISFL